MGTTLYVINDPTSYEDGRSADAERQLLAMYDPARLDLCRQALKRSRLLAETLLKQGMLRDGSWTKVASDLTNNQKWLSQHGAVISCDDAASIGLRVEYIAPDAKLWQAYWRLYCEQRLALSTDSPKAFRVGLRIHTLQVTVAAEGRGGLRSLPRFISMF